MRYSKLFQVALLSASIFIMDAAPSAAMKDDEDEETSSLVSLRQSRVIDSSSSMLNDHSSIHQENEPSKTSLCLNDLPDEVLYSIMNFLDIGSLGRLSYVNCRFYQVTSDNNLWAHRLTRDKIIPLLGKAWDNYPSNVLSYKSYYAALHFLQNLPENGEDTVKVHLQLAILPDSAFSQKCLCLFYRMLAQKEMVSRCFYRAAELGDKLSQEIVVDTLYKGHGPAEEKYQKLLFLAEKGWKYAQEQAVDALSSPVGVIYSFGWNKTHDEWRYQELFTLAQRGWGGREGLGSGLVRVPNIFFRIAEALYEGKLGCDKRPGEERYQELISLAEEGWESAQEKVAYALSRGELGWNKIPKEERYQKLLIYAERGWYDAQKMISEALARGWLGHDKRSEADRYQELVSYAEKGWKSAQYQVAETLRTGGNGWSKKPVEERYQAYVSCAKKGWGKAQADIARILYERGFGWDKVPEEKLYKRLCFLAEKGWGDTRYVVYSLYEGKFSCNKMSRSERYNKLVSLAARGDKCAQERVTCSVVRGELVWNKISEEDRYLKLIAIAEKGWEHAQAEVVGALYSGRLGQDQRSEKERYEKLIILAEKNWNFAQDRIADAHKYNMLGEEYAFYWSPSHDYYGRDLRPRKSRNTPPLYFKKYKNANYFRLLRALVTDTITTEGFRLLREEQTAGGTPTILDTELILHMTD